LPNRQNYSERTKHHHREREQRYPQLEVPVFRFEGRFPVESPPETREQKTKQDAADWQDLTSAAVYLHEPTSDSFAVDLSTLYAVYKGRYSNSLRSAPLQEEPSWLADQSPHLSLAKVLSRRAPLRGKG
jgi:hypothetical protein